MSLVSREKGMLRSSVESNESRVVEFISVGSDGDFLVACEVLVRGEEDREWSSDEGRSMEISLSPLSLIHI